jgi:heme exporter protein A
LITGRNGSGKSTLVKILCGVLTPTEGTVRIGGTRARRDIDIPSTIGMVSPYLQLYDEFTGEENLHLALSIRGRRPDPSWSGTLMEKVGLGGRGNDLVRTYSSGMKQRLKYAFALVHRPTILVLDEPMANLDADGIAVVRAIMGEHRRKGILVVATNDLTDVDHFDLRVHLDRTDGQ